MTRVGLPDYDRRAHERHADNRMVLIVRSAYVVTECYIDYCDFNIYKRVLTKPPWLRRQADPPPPSAVRILPHAPVPAAERSTSHTHSPSTGRQSQRVAQNRRAAPLVSSRPQEHGNS